MILSMAGPIMVKWMNKPESLLTAAAIGLIGAVVVLLNLSLASCQSAGATRMAGAGVRGQPLARTPYLPPRAESFGDRGPDLRIRVRSAVESASVGAAGGEVLVWPGAAGAPARSVRSKGPVQVRLAGGEFVLSAPEGEARFNAAEGVWVAVVPARGAPAGQAMVMLDGARYPGRLRILPRSDAAPGALDVIEYVPLEDYLPGVVGKEMLTGWPLTAFQVQAVCARTYALQERGLSLLRGETFDLESSDRDQVYGGASANATVQEAVRSTRGLALRDGGAILRAYYSSTCGGRTASARDTWPTGRGYEYNLAAPIQAHTRPSACEISPLHRWTVTRDRAELEQRIRAFGERQKLLVRKLRTLHSIEPMAFNDDGRPSRYKIIEPGGAWYELSGEELRLACNNSVPAPAATAAGVGAPPAGLPVVDRKSRVHSSDFEVKVRGNVVTFTGRGFGHGVGMCQYCAKAFADRGEDWRTIVHRFYPGAAIERQY